MSSKKLNEEGLSKVWTNVFELIKVLTGDVEVTGKGPLQEQINNHLSADNPHGITSVESAGTCTGNSSTATKLETARTIRTNLASTSEASFDGGADVTPGVTGILSVANGGTGASTAADAKVNLELENVDNTADTAKPVSAAQQKAIDAAYANAVAYADKAVADLVGTAPETLNTLGEIADAFEENEEVVEALNAAIGNKANQAELDTHTGNDTIHITESERTKWNGALAASGGDSKNNVTTFTSGDSTSPAAWSDVAALQSGEKHSSIFNKISTMFKNIRWLYKMLGTTDISAIGDGTATGAIAALNNALGTHTSNKSNPHGVTKSQIGLGNVNNTADSDKIVKHAGSAGDADTVDGVHVYNMWSNIAIDRAVSFSGSIGANNNVTVTVTAPAVSGYEPYAIIRLYGGSALAIPFYWDVNTSTRVITIGLANHTEWAADFNGWAVVLYRRVS